MTKDWLFDENLSSTRITLKLLGKRPSLLPCLPLSWAETEADCCLFVFTMRAPRLHVWRRWIDGMKRGRLRGCTGISYSPFYSVYSACGWRHETLPAWKLNVTRRRNVTIFRVFVGKSYFVASRLSFLVSSRSYCCISSHDSFCHENSNSDRRRKVWNPFK